MRKVLKIKNKPKFKIDEGKLLYTLLLEKDNSGSVIEKKALQEGFKRQNHRHVTIIGGTTKTLLKNILDRFSEKERIKILKKIKNLLASLDWEFIPKEIYKIKKNGCFTHPNSLEKRESYICIIDMPDIEFFYKTLNLWLKTNLPPQLPHITLFTKGEIENPEYYGIPISSLEEFNKANPEILN